MSIFCEHLLGADININKQQGKLSKPRETLYIDFFTLQIIYIVSRTLSTVSGLRGF